MSIHSYFHSRKSRNSQGAKQDVNFAAQAPQPIYDTLTKSKPNNAQKPNKNSILYYLSPTTTTASPTTTSPTTTSPVKTLTTKESNTQATNKDIFVIDESTSPCRIRKKIPLLTIWDDIMEEFDPESFTNQLVVSPVINKEKEKEVDVKLDEPCQIRKKLEIATVWKDILQEFDPESQLVQDYLLITNDTDRKRKFTVKEDGARNVRIRTCLNPDIINQSMFIEDYLEDMQEDLSRPLRTKLTLEQAKNVLLQMTDEVFMFTESYVV